MTAVLTWADSSLVHLYRLVQAQFSQFNPNIEPCVYVFEEPVRVYCESNYECPFILIKIVLGTTQNNCSRSNLIADVSLGQAEVLESNRSAFGANRQTSDVSERVRECIRSSNACVVFIEHHILREFSTKVFHKASGLGFNSSASLCVETPYSKKKSLTGQFHGFLRTLPGAQTINHSTDISSLSLEPIWY